MPQLCLAYVMAVKSCMSESEGLPPSMAKLHYKLGNQNWMEPCLAQGPRSPGGPPGELGVFCFPGRRKWRKQLQGSYKPLEPGALLRGLISGHNYGSGARYEWPTVMFVALASNDTKLDMGISKSSLCLGLPMIRIIVHGGLFWGHLSLETLIYLYTIIPLP